MTYTYRLNGLKIASDLELPQLVPWDGAADAPADAAFHLGHVPPQLETPDHVAPVFQTKGRNEYLLAVPGTGRILVRNGSEVMIEPEPGADPTAIRAFVIGPVQAILWHQRGLLPMHASVVTIEGRALALAGHSAVGKSTLAALLAAKGHQVIADDICVVDARKNAEAVVLPGFPRLMLWRDALDRFGMPAEGLLRALQTREAYLVDLRQDLVYEPQRLAAVVVLVRLGSGTLKIERLRGYQAVGALEEVVHTRRPARNLGCGPNIFAGLTRLVAGVAVWRLTTTDDPACVDEAVAMVLAVLGV